MDGPKHDLFAVLGRRPGAQFLAQDNIRYVSDADRYAAAIGDDDALQILADKDVTGKEADAALGRAHITVNKNSVPNDPRPPMVTSGIRIGTPAVTTRGFKEAEVAQLAHWIADVLTHPNDEAVIAKTRTAVEEICRRFPVYGG